MSFKGFQKSVVRVSLIMIQGVGGVFRIDTYK
jgi:hypothetical protein